MQNILTTLAAVRLKDTNGGNGEDLLTGSDGAIATILSNVILVLGFVAVIVVVVGGVMYLTSQGDAGKTKRGKDTILGGVIGLIICALAFAIVNFAVFIINKTQDDGGSGGAYLVVEEKAVGMGVKNYCNFGEKVV